MLCTGELETTPDETNSNNKETASVSGETVTTPPHTTKHTDTRCRLCHSATLTTASPNIYESVADFCKKDSENVLLVDLCFKMLGLRYERHEYLPERICLRCIAFLDDLYEQRKFMEQREMELQMDLKSIINIDPKYRPGLNGNDGVFVAEKGCVIVEVDPDQICETSDDEFLGTDAEDEEEDEEDEEEVQNDDADMTLSMSSTQMHSLVNPYQTVDAATSVSRAADLNMHPKSAFLCQYCDMAFTLQPDCQQHELVAHNPNAPYCCNYCRVLLSTRPALITHIKELHDAERPYVCAHCSKGFCRRSDLKKHTIVHTGVRPYTCNVCSKSFSRNTNLTKHLRIHSSVKPFVCQQCPRSFQTPLELLKHTRTHAEVKPYQCARCPSSFTRKDKLMMHQQVHDRRDIEQQQNKARIGSMQAIGGDQPMLPVHPYVDAELSQQQQQQSKQSPIMPRSAGKATRNFRCDVCDKGFQRERDLQRHRALHLDSLFQCKTCGQGFSRREKLQRHENEVHGPFYTCSICQMTFHRYSDMETHTKVHELQNSVAKSTHEAMKAAVMATNPNPMAEQPEAMPAILAERVPPPVPPTAAELSFYSNMIPTMNLGFYSETRPEERNGIF